MSDVIKKIITILISMYITIFISNLFWEKYETNKINVIIKKNYEEALDKLKKAKKISNSAHYVTLNEDDYKNYQKKIEEYDIYPLSTFSNQELFLCNESGENVFIKTDNYGFRNKNEDYINSDIYLVGDSYGLGMCHSEENFFVNKLERKIINLSQSGSSTLRQSITLREYAKFNENTKLLWLFNLGNDLDELSIELNNPYLKKYSNWKFTQNLLKKNTLKDKLLSEFKITFEKTDEKEILKRFALKKNDNFLKLAKFSFTRNKINEKFFHLYSDTIINEYIRIILETKKKMSINDLTIIILPDARVFNYGKYRKLYKIEYIKQKLNSNGIKIIDLPKFHQKDDFFDFFYSNSTHYKNETGEIIKNTILYCLNKNQDLDCK